MKEVIERCNWLVNKCNDKAITPDVKDDFRYLLEEIQRLNKDLKDACEVIERLKEDKKKAIEYIENHQLNFKKGTTTFGSERLSIEERKLLDILRGSDKE